MKDKKKELDKMYYGTLGMCGCGNPQDLKQFLVDIMEAQALYIDGKITFEERQKKRQEAFEKCRLDTVLEFILHVFDANDFWEHGSYVGNGCMTDEGYRLLHLLKQDLNGTIIFPDDIIDEMST